MAIFAYFQNIKCVYVSRGKGSTKIQKCAYIIYVWMVPKGEVDRTSRIAGAKQPHKGLLEQVTSIRAPAESIT